MSLSHRAIDADYVIEPCANPKGWTSVGWVKKGPQCGTFVPVPHWGDRDLAILHVALLNRGLSREEALASVEALCHREPASDDPAA